MEKVSKDGVITIEESKTSDTNFKIVEGMQLKNGYISPYMVTDNEKMEAIMDNSYILITDKKISNIQEILPLFESSCQNIFHLSDFLSATIWSNSFLVFSSINMSSFFYTFDTNIIILPFI